MEDHTIEYLLKDFKRPQNVKSGCYKTEREHLCYHFGDNEKARPGLEEDDGCWGICPGHRFKYKT